MLLLKLTRHGLSKAEQQRNCDSYRTWRWNHGNITIPRACHEQQKKYSNSRRVEMEFFEHQFNKDSSLLLHATHNPFYWRIWRKLYSSLVLKILTKNPLNLSLFINSILKNRKMRAETLKNLILRRLKFMPRNLD